MRTLVVGASPNPARVSYTAIHRLLSEGQSVIAYGIRQGHVGDVPIITDKEAITGDFDTITLYVGPGRQDEELKDWIVSLGTKRVIFNPGTENYEFEERLRGIGVEVLRACTLVMLSIGAY
jgi:predicted CoA-binding protein